MPMPIYSRFIQRIGVYLLPFLVITNFAPMMVMNQLTPALAVWGAIVPIVLLVIVRFVWSRAIRNYKCKRLKADNMTCICFVRHCLSMSYLSIGGASRLRQPPICALTASAH
ncbi:ABC-2 family transporter protein [Paenibacillus polymyxa]|uniref:ABC-2 family transporter protein n=1 Tax=Paenibacillus polymyxa TaxID=1406 RepID=UPI000A5A1FD0|nr:ABC-2 family transporter protein [Paenibacillus polymyxa]